MVWLARSRVQRRNAPVQRHSQRAEEVLQRHFVEQTLPWREFQPNFLPVTELEFSARSHPSNLKGHVWLHWCHKAGLLASLVPHGAHRDWGAPPARPSPMNRGAWYQLHISWAGPIVLNFRRVLWDACVLPNGNHMGTVRKPCNSCCSLRPLMKMLSFWDRFNPYSKLKSNVGSGIFIFFLDYDLMCRSALSKCSHMSSNYYTSCGSAFPSQNWINRTNIFYLKLSPTANETNCNLHFCLLSLTLTLCHVLDWHIAVCLCLSPADGLALLCWRNK